MYSRKSTNGNIARKAGAPIFFVLHRLFLPRLCTTCFFPIPDPTNSVPPDMRYGYWHPDFVGPTGTSGAAAAAAAPPPPATIKGLYVCTSKVLNKVK